MIEEDCSICGKTGFVYANGNPLCLKHDVSEYWKNNKGCLEAHLDSLIERLEKYGKLDKDELDFLKEIKVQMPEMVNEFPVLFEKIK